MRWEQFDLENGVWTKPATTTKQRLLHRAPLSRAAVELLRAIREGVPDDCPWVFPGEKKGHPLREMQSFWEGVRDKAQLGDARIHDLRHTFASLLVSRGMTLPKLAKFCGATGQRHVRLARSSHSARRGQSGGSHDGSMSTCSTPSSSASMPTRVPCVSVARQSSIRSAR
jgi:integrase